jgi:hypothetical protein
MHDQKVEGTYQELVGKTVAALEGSESRRVVCAGTSGLDHTDVGGQGHGGNNSFQEHDC